MGAPFTARADVRLVPASELAHPALILPSALALLAVARLALRPVVSRVLLLPAAAVVVLSGVATLAHYPVPLWSVVVALLVIAVAASTRDLTLAAVLGGGALVVGLPSASLTVLTTAVIVVASASLLRRPAAALVLPAAVGGLLWSLGEVAGIDVSQRGVPVVLAVGLLAIVVHREEIEASAAVTAFVASTAAVAAATNESAALALHLTVLGALVSGTALLHRDRRQAAWVGGLLLAAATWIRLADIGVDTPEAYTLPSAAALLVIGLDRLRRHPTAPTWTALSPACCWQPPRRCCGAWPSLSRDGRCCSVAPA